MSHHPVRPRVAILGLGRIANAHWDALQERDDITFVGAAEPDAQNAAAWRKRGIEVFPDAAALYGAVEPTALIVCAPPQVHEQLVAEALERGQHLLVEKPIAMTAAEAKGLIAAARERGCVLQTASKFGVMPALGRAASLIREGAIGRVVRVENVFSGVLDIRQDWRADPVIGGGGVWMDNGPHSLDVLNTLGGPPNRLRMTERRTEQGTAVEDHVAVELEFEGKVAGTITLTWNEQMPAPIARVVGAEGEIEVGWRETVVRTAGAEQKLPGGYDKNECFRRVHDRFFDAIDARAGSSSGAEDRGMRVMESIEAGYRSAADDGAWIELP